MEQTVLPIHFEDRSGTEFERLAFAYAIREKDWNSIEWLGQTGKDGGRDIWGEFSGDTYCYQCANYRELTFKKAKDDIDKLIKNKMLPHTLIIVCGGKVTTGLRAKIISYAMTAGTKKVSVWSGTEFEERLRKHTPELIRRFILGEKFPCFG